MKQFVIIGAGQAGAQAAQSLRQSGFQGNILLIGEEPVLPYQRPPLSKAYLKGDMAEERLYLRPRDFYDKNEISVRLDDRVETIDRTAQRIVTQQGEQFSYDQLLLATGAPPRRLTIPGANLTGVHYLRTLSDSDNLREILSVNGRVLIIGAGYIGLEVAAVTRALGCQVSVIEIADRVLARVACMPVSRFFEDRHKKEGVDFRFGVGVEALLGENGRVCAVQLSDGSRLDCAAVLVGIGAVPATDLAVSCGLNIDNGIVVDEYARTSDPNIWAAGDCANFPSQLYQRRMRLESVPNAIEQAKIAGVNMTGANKIYEDLPWFWSDQYDVKLQTIGLGQGADEIIERRDPKNGGYSVWQFLGEQLLCVDAINEPGAFATGRKVITSHVHIDKNALADPNVAFIELLK